MQYWKDKNSGLFEYERMIIGWRIDRWLISPQLLVQRNSISKGKGNLFNSVLCLCVSDFSFGKFFHYIYQKFIQQKKAFNFSIVIPNVPSLEID